MSNLPIYPQGMDERINKACELAGITKSEASKLAGFHRNVLYSLGSTHSSINSGYLAEFCRVTGADANWILGLTEKRR